MQKKKKKEIKQENSDTSFVHALGTCFVVFFAFWCQVTEQVIVHLHLFCLLLLFILFAITLFSHYTF